MSTCNSTGRNVKKSKWGNQLQEDIKIYNNEPWHNQNINDKTT